MSTESVVSSSAAPRPSPLARLHESFAGRMIAFAGWSLPVMYPTGIKAEHLHTRAEAGLFDVSHMGQIVVFGAGAHQALETIFPSDLSVLPAGRMRYSVLLNDAGGIVDDVMITSFGDHYFLVVNAAHTDADYDYIQSVLLPGVTAELLEGRAMLAVQGPSSGDVLGEIIPQTKALYFMEAMTADWEGKALIVSRSGYTGEDGFEVSGPAEDIEKLAWRLLDDARVKPVGLGARDSLRLEAGLPLSGQDIDATTSPVEAGLSFAIGKSRRASGGFPGARRILAELKNGPARRLVGLLPEGRQAARTGAPLSMDDRAVGAVTSGGFASSLDRPVSMGYVESSVAQEGRTLSAKVRDKDIAVTIAPLPFVPHRYRRRPAK